MGLHPARPRLGGYPLIVTVQTDTIRWQRGDRAEYVLSGQRLGDHGMTEVLGTICRARTKGVLATSVLGEHTDEAGRCVVCGSAWPGERVVLAAHNLAVI